MLILTEKPSVAKDFANALGCFYSSSEKAYKSADGNLVIINCVGHLYNLAEPAAYDQKFKSWKNLPVIPEQFIYFVNSSVKDVEKTVIKQLRKHKVDSILVATDADREGEIIARECLLKAGINDLSKCKRFWVSQALVPSVIKQGIAAAAPLEKYDFLALQGFARQKADWLIGMNATRFITNKAGTLYPIGRVQTAILAEISSRCDSIKNFKSERYFEFEASFGVQSCTFKVNGTYADGENTRFTNTDELNTLKQLTGSLAVCKELKKDVRNIKPPKLYNLNDLQKDAYNYFGFSAEKTLKIVQTLYEQYKCVSYPRTASKVMGTENIQLCKNLFFKFIGECPEYFQLHSLANIEITNKHVFDNSKLESHHAIIPLAKIPNGATFEEENIFYLILERFMLAFAPECQMEILTAKLGVQQCTFEVKGQRYIYEGWRKFRTITRKKQEEELQDLSNIDFENLYLQTVEPLEKHTKAPKYYNEATILAFMENPKNEEGKKLVGLGTPATRHSFIPKLQKLELIKVENKNFMITSKGSTLLKELNNSAFKALADVEETTNWEEELAQNPNQFLADIKEYVQKGCALSS